MHLSVLMAIILGLFEKKLFINLPTQNPALFSRHPAKLAGPPVCPAVGGSDPGAGGLPAPEAGGPTGAAFAK